MATLSLPSAKQTTTGEHRETKELRKGRLVLFVLLTAYSGLLMYLLWGDLVSVASVQVTYVGVGLLLCRLSGCWEQRRNDDGGRRWQLDAVLWLVFLSSGVLQVSRLARTAASSTSVPMLLAAVGAAALGVGGCCAYLLHRRSWSKQQRQELIFMPLRQDPRS
ncbi:uncharacterized protein LOC110434377 [Sorghum bicolor]|uniref:Uncharacterized protein n=1 Tax=Sorghum bicolor TaxID=4558 RepID=A0A194YNN6_SORBI|nr:uncharacterized protein LOC110434377 [Sorghum bicolor]KXG29807.1 hypothetical protein SORBI_3004G092200 [Sorghum bicolor]|eukprot:XP_021313951.1 uncharacterized protein LOC110434377 [Sorghum bicolor]